MSTGLGLLRLVALALGLGALLAGLATLSVGAGFAGGLIPGIQLVGLGVVIIAVTLLERARYRSDALDRSGAGGGPGGGEPPGGTLEPRFQRSDEVFIDPTSEHRMRVWIDTSSGERRYVAED
ncbi:MAG: hypothetical protein QOG32_345 [Chloroflexota bacterium]|nr:hypothetical protein [Chloroflexota bacterium]